jgi:hypothetical protein
MFEKKMALLAWVLDCVQSGTNIRKDVDGLKIAKERH